MNNFRSSDVVPVKKMMWDSMADEFVEEKMYRAKLHFSTDIGPIREYLQQTFGPPNVYHKGMFWDLRRDILVSSERVYMMLRLAF